MWKESKGVLANPNKENGFIPADLENIGPFDQYFLKLSPLLIFIALVAVGGQAMLTQNYEQFETLLKTYGRLELLFLFEILQNYMVPLLLHLLSDRQLYTEDTDNSSDASVNPVNNVPLVRLAKSPPQEFGRLIASLTRQFSNLNPNK